MFRTRLGAALRARALVAIVTVTLVAALTVTSSGSALAEDGPSKQFEPLDINTVQLAGGFKPASLRLDRPITVILELGDASVSKQSANAKKQGKELSKAERDAIRASLKANQDALRGRVASTGATVLFDYQDAYNGLAVKTALKDIAALQALPGVVAVHPSRTFELDNTAGVQYIEANDAWADTGKTGNGVKIAVLDTGVDYFHANFGGSGDPAQFANDNHTIVEAGSFPTAKVVGGTDFVGDAFDASSDDPAATTPHPDPDPVDCNGHGSHVAGTAGGFGVRDSGATYTGPYDGTTYSNAFRIGPGAAPKASIIAVRVFGCEGSTSEAILVAALNYASAQGADVVNMSLGSPFGRDEEPSTVASNDISDDGVVVVVSSGNSGSSGYITGAPAVASRAISVAAVDASSATFPGANATLSSGKTVLMQNSNDAALPSGALGIAVLRTSYPSGPVSLGCDPAEYTGFPGGVSGKLVVTVRGTCARVARAIFGQQAGAAAVAMINTSSAYPPFEGEITSNPDTGEPFNVTIPFLGVRGVLGPAATADGDDLVAADGGTATLAAATVPNPGYKNFASFTSGGPANVDSDVKPEVTAPGVSVLSTAVGTGNKGTRISGTSMAAPHTAGVAALVTEAHPTWTTEQIKSAIVHTADASAAKIGNYNPRLGGAGVVDARKAVDSAGVAITSNGSGTLSFGYEAMAAAYSESLPLTLRNTGTSAITYNLAAAFNGNVGLTASFAPSGPVTVPAGGSVTIQVTLQLTAAGVAALPSAETSNFGALVTARGAITATPTTTGTGVYQLRVPFIVAPRGLSAIAAGPKSAYTRSGSTFTANVPLNNTGIRSGTADVYAWGINDANDVSSFSDDPMDIRAVGVQTFELPGGSTDRLLVFAINGWGRWSNASVNEFDIAIDSKGNSAPEFFIVGVDFGAVTAGSFDGRFAAFVFDAAGNLLAARIAIAPMNGSTVLLPALASELGLDPAVNSTKFSYSVAGFSIVPGTLVDTTGVASFRSHQPPVSTGDFVTVGPGASGNFTVTADSGKNAGTPQLGWMVVTLDDANGTAQADLIPIGALK
jgi:subtilisin family serine protease